MSQPGVIDGLAFARGGSQVQGVLPEKALPRLAEAVSRVGEVSYAVRGGFNERDKPSIRVEARADLELTCQRCLEAMVLPISVVAELELSEDEREIAQAEDDIDRVLATPAMQVAQLVEDELLLALPDVPKHAACAAPGDAVGGKGRPSPFEVLKGLKR
jgi:uncharacterized protein